ncbi:MAG: bifunctional folylpolyglutamate synthase/dihydrofolate synthase [Candidatus Omnitrophica bacterium]|nr:bifunctional folylpolyglutamate synthase/dihydrofolate synthase [Candidatus Omnitrophota bacterium]
METLLERLGHPEKGLLIVHIAGTNGKGSTAAFLGSIGRAHGCRVGVYTSPHLSDVRERICIDGDMIGRREFGEGLDILKGILGNWPKNLGRVTYFEIMTALALLHFRRNECDFVILEVGLGGRLDATNAVRTSLSVFTEIGLDHQKWLGTTIQKIAKEKAGIIKEGVPVCTGYQLPSAERVIRRRSKELGSPLFKLVKPRFIKMSPRGLKFDLSANGIKNLPVKTSLAGRFQMNNAGLAALAYSILHNLYGFRMHKRLVQKGLASISWPGRFEVLKMDGLTFILDGGHNEPAIKVLVDSILKLFPDRMIRIIFGASRDKAVQAILEELAQLKSSLYVTSAAHPRAANASDLAEKAKRYFDRVYCLPNIRKALRAVRRDFSRNGVALITGSLFLVREAREILCRK